MYLHHIRPISFMPRSMRCCCRCWFPCDPPAGRHPWICLPVLFQIL